MKLSDYPTNWKELSRWIRFERAGGQCECRGECGQDHGFYGRCTELNGRIAESFRGMVMLTVAHLDHDTHSADPDNLRAMCQKCHLLYDVEHHQETRRRKRLEALIQAGQLNFDFSFEE